MGFFSFITKDTNKIIYNVYSKHYPKGAMVSYMVNPKTKEIFKEEKYDGYGSFGGKDFFVLYAELNDLITEDIKDDITKIRSVAIEHYYYYDGEKIYPVIIENLENLEEMLKTNIEPEDHVGQGYWNRFGYNEYEDKEEDE